MSREIGVISDVAPVFAAVGWWVLLGETVGPPAPAGFLVILAGFALVKRRALTAEWRAARGGRR